MCLSVHQFSLKVVGQSYIPHLRLDCKTVGFFLKIVLEESKRSVSSVRASRAGSARASHARRACVASLPSLALYFKILFNCSCVVCSTLLAEAFPFCFSALYCHSLRGFGCSRFILVVSVPRKRPLQTAVWDSC